MNNVETSKSAITKICPELITYFKSGARPSMFDLAMLHATARSKRVYIRRNDSKEVSEYTRRAEETIESFYRRLINGQADEAQITCIPDEVSPRLAFLYSGDIEFSRESSVYALFREKVTSSLAASDLLS